MHPCPYCVASKNNLHEKGIDRTIGRIKAMHDKWLKETEGDAKKAKKYENCINDPLLTANDEETIINLIPPPELHLMIGITTTLFNALNKKEPELCHSWIEKCNIKMDHYGAFNGNASRKLLKNVKILKDLAPENKFIPLFHLFDRIVHACFGEDLDANYSLLILQFSKQLDDLKIKITPKIHILLFHVPEFVELTGKALGFYSEQASESVHHAYKNHAQNYKGNLCEESAQEKLKRSVTTFNCVRQ